jgi:hypothetical protein
MSITNKLQSNLYGWVAVAITIVIGSIILLKFKSANPGNMTCPGANASHTVYDSANNVCCLAADNCASGNQSVINGLAQTTDTFIGALAEPKNWVSIVVIALIGFAVLYMFAKKQK